MRESRTYGSGRGACDETHVPTATRVQVFPLRVKSALADGYSRPIVLRSGWPGDIPARSGNRRGAHEKS
jgi:hypothetical protein